MTSRPTRITTPDRETRALFLLSAATPEEALAVKGHLDRNRFVALIAWDAQTASVGEISVLAEAMLGAGCVYFCCWGPDCERVHDVIDEVYVGDRTSSAKDAGTVMTTWHANVPLDEALWFTLNVAHPDHEFDEGAKTILAVSIGNHSWASQIAAALADTAAFSERVLGKDENAA